MEGPDKERYYRLRFYAFLGCGAVVSIFYIITLGVAFRLAQERTTLEMRMMTFKLDRVMSVRKTEHDRIMVQLKALGDCSFRSHREILDKLEALRSESRGPAARP